MTKDIKYEYIDYVINNQEHIGYLLLYCFTTDICNDLYNIVKLPKDELKNIVKEKYNELFKNKESDCDKYNILNNMLKCCDSMYCLGNCTIEVYAMLIFNIAVYKYYDKAFYYIKYSDMKYLHKNKQKKVMYDEIRLFKYLHEIIIALMDNGICKSEKGINIVDELHDYTDVLTYVHAF